MTSVFSRYESVFEKYALSRSIKRMVDARVAQGKPAWQEGDTFGDALSQFGASRGEVERYAGGRALSKEVAQAQNFDAQKHHLNSFFSALPTGQTPLEQKFVNPSRAIGVQFANSADTVSAPGSLTAKALGKAVPLQNYAREAPNVLGPDLTQRLSTFKANRAQQAADASAGVLRRAGNWALDNPIKSLGVVGGLALGSKLLMGNDKPAPSGMQQVMPYDPYDFTYKGASWQGYAKSVGAGAAAGGVGGYLMAGPENKARGALGGMAVGGALGGGAKYMANNRARGVAGDALGALKKNFDSEQTDYYNVINSHLPLTWRGRSFAVQLPDSQSDQY